MYFSHKYNQIIKKFKHLFKLQFISILQVFILNMGNTNDATNQNHKNKLINYKIPQNYYQNCHPNFLDFNIDQKQQYLLTAFILINSESERWKKRLQPLLSTKYILNPCRILTNNYFYQKGCCSSQHSQQIDGINIAYQPFIYSLNREISSRKLKNQFFTEQEIWKVIKYLTKGLVEWHSIYPYQRIQTIMPENVVINFKGNLRIVTQHSFPKDSYFHKPKTIYQAPEDKTSSVIKYQNQPNRFKILSSDLYAIGMTALDCLLLQKNYEPNFSTVLQKINHMFSLYQEKFSRQLKNIIATLLNQDYKKRPNPHDLISLAQISQKKFQ